MIRHPAALILSATLFMAAAPRFDWRSPHAQESIPAFDTLLAHPVRLRPELVGVPPRVFVTAAELSELRTRARTTHRDEWQRALASLISLSKDPPPVPGPQERRSQNDVALQIAGTSIAYAI